MMAAADNCAKVSSSDPENSNVTFVDSFKAATSKLQERFLKSIKFEEFKVKYFPEIYEKDPDFLKDIHEQFLQHLREAILSDTDVLCSDQHVYSKLEEFDKLVKESKFAPEDVKTWRPSGDPEEDIKDHKYRYKLAHKKALQSLLDSVRSENDQLDKEVMADHEEIMMLKERIMKQDEQNQAEMKALEEVDFNMFESIELPDDES